MFFCKPSYILFRDCQDFGYLTDNRNFGYDTASSSCFKVGDRILSKTGSIFYSILSEKPQSLSELSAQLSNLFCGVSRMEIENDAESFYKELSRDGFIIYCNNLETVPFVNRFSYSNWQPFDLSVDESGEEEAFQLNLNWGTKYHLNRVHVDISGLCNEHCVHCYIPDAYKNKTMSLPLFQEVLEQSKICKVLNITISGGEPMLNPNLPLYIKLCRDNNFSINILSNLTLLTEELVHLFETTPLLSVQTSLYSMNADIHDAITNVTGSFLKTKKAIELLHQHNVPMQINCPIMKQNINTYQDVLDWAKSLNIEGTSDYQLFGCFDGSQKNLKNRLSISEVETLLRAHHREDREGTHSISSKYDDGLICPICTDSICVSHAGDLYPCEGWQSFILGNITEVSLSKVWDYSPKVQELRTLSLSDFPKCITCEDKDYCSICLIRNANESKSGNYKDVNSYFCQIAHLKRTTK